MRIKMVAALVRKISVCAYRPTYSWKEVWIRLSAAYSSDKMRAYAYGTFAGTPSKMDSATVRLGDWVWRMLRPTSEREDLPSVVRMLIFTRYHVRSAGIRYAQSSDIQEEPIGGVDEASVNNVGAISSNSFPGPWVDVKHVFSTDVVFGIVILVICHVVTFAQQLQRVSGHLSVKIPIL